MDIATIAEATVTFLAPFTPYLIGAASFSAAAIAEQVVQGNAEKVWSKAQTIWSIIKDRYSDDTAIMQAAQMISDQPDSDQLQARLVNELANRLQAEPEVAEQLAPLLQEESVQSVIVARNSSLKKALQKQTRPGNQSIQVTDDSSAVNIKQINE